MLGCKVTAGDFCEWHNDISLAGTSPVLGLIIPKPWLDNENKQNILSLKKGLLKGQASDFPF